jgi:hypothetical protein
MADVERRLTWGKSTRAGFTVVPRVFLRGGYIDLGLSMEEAMVVITILDYCWDDGMPPYPKVATLCANTGVSEYVMRGLIRSLRDKGVLLTVNRAGRSNAYDFTPLFTALHAMAEGKTRNSDEDSALMALADLSTSGSAMYLADADEGDDYGCCNSLPVAAVPPVTTHTEQQPRNEDSSLRSESSSADAGIQDRILKAVAAKRQEKEQRDTERQKVRKPAEAPAPQKKAFVSGEKRQKWEEVPTEKWNTSHLESFWKHHSWAYLKQSALWAGAERKLVKTLLDHYGPELMRKVFHSFTRDWEKWRTKLRVDAGVPSVKILYGYRDTVFPAVAGAGVTTDHKPRWGSHNANVYVDDEAKDNNDTGEDWEAWL